jgi:clathrin heavy chain
VEDVIKTKPDCYDVPRVKDLLLELRLQDPKPLICLCDIHGLID